MTDTESSQMKRHSSGFVMYLGFTGMMAMVLAIVYLPQSELLTNTILFLNIWTIGGLAVYLFCWTIAFYQLFCQKTIRGVIDLGVVSVLYFMALLFVAYNTRLLAVIFLLVLSFLQYVLWAKSYFRKYYVMCLKSG